MLSQKTRYTIRAFQHLADHWGKGQVQLADIAEAQNIPPKSLTVILSEMAREGLPIRSADAMAAIVCAAAGRHQLCAILCA